MSVLGGEGNIRGYKSSRHQMHHGILTQKSDRKVWVRVLTLPRSLGGVSYGVMFDLTSLSANMLTISSIVSGSGPQAKSGAKAWVFICDGSHVNKEMQSDLWHNVGEGDLVMPRPSFKAAEYGNYGELPLQKAFAVYPNQTVGVCIMTSSREGIVVREGEALKKPGVTPFPG